MSNTLTSDQVWNAIENELFAVLGMVTAKHESRTAGIVYIVRNRKLYIGTGRDTWKARHIAANPSVSMTVPIAKRIPFMPWIKIPSATVTFSGIAKVLDAANTAPDLLRAVFQKNAVDPAEMARSVVIEVTPVGEFVTYGVGVSLMQMRTPELARGRAPVA